MKLLSISDPSAIDIAVREIHQRPILIQLPTVFVLLAAPTNQGAQQLDNLKTRLDGKNYGTAIGSLHKFIAQANPYSLPDDFRCVDQYADLAGTFIRLQFRDEHFQSKTIRNGTHQGLLLTGTYLYMFDRIETSFEPCSPDAIWNHTNYCAPLCTSCNISGDPDGSITEFDKAVDFAKQRGVGLFITATDVSMEKGSYPILGFEKDKVTIHREGPGLDLFKTKIPAALRTW